MVSKKACQLPKKMRSDVAVDKIRFVLVLTDKYVLKLTSSQFIRHKNLYPRLDKPKIFSRLFL